MTTEPNRIPGAHWARLSDWHAAQAAPHMRRRNMNAMPRIEAVLDYEEFEQRATAAHVRQDMIPSIYRKYLVDMQNVAKRAARDAMEGVIQTALIQQDGDYYHDYIASETATEAVV